MDAQTISILTHSNFVTTISINATSCIAGKISPSPDPELF